MKLDTKILPGRKPLTCFDTEEAKKFINKLGYFTNEFCHFEYLKQCPYGYLRRVDGNRKPFVISNSNQQYEFFIPIEWLTEQEFRPFTLDEFNAIYQIGDLITFRSKNGTLKIVGSYSGYAVLNNDYMTPSDCGINIGSKYYSLQTFFNDYELFNEESESWQPFGTEVTK